MAKTIFTHIPDESACSLYRNRLPFMHCYSELSKHGILLVGDEKPQEKEDFDVFCINRIVRARFFQEYCVRMIESDKTLVWQTDDDLWNIPEWNPSSELLEPGDLECTKVLMDRANQIFVSTDELAEAVNFPDKTTVLPNLIDLALFGERKNINNPDIIKIVWMGSSSHDIDLEQVVTPIEKIVKDFSNVVVIFWGYLPTGLGTFVRKPGFPYAHIVPRLPNVYFGEWFTGRTYFRKLVSLEPDIAIMPLADCKFNNSKSNLKYLEMSMAGAACIATDLPPYKCIKHLETGILIEDPLDWYDAIANLIKDKELRQKLASNAQEQIRQEYSWQCSKKDLWLNAFLKVANLK